MAGFVSQRWPTTKGNTITEVGLSKGALLAVPLRIIFFCDLLKHTSHTTCNDPLCHTPSDIKRKEKQRKETLWGPVECSGQFLVISL